MDYAEIKKFVDMPRLLESYGIALVKDRCACPIHGGDNKTAFGISSQGQCWTCHTKCECSGDIFSFVEKFEKVTNPVAKQLIEDRFNLSSPAPVKIKKAPKPKASVVGRVEYVYRDKDGKTLYKVKRVDYSDGKKDCFQECQGKPTLPESVRTLYNYDKIHGNTEDYVILCEGEKTADAVTECGYIGTTNPLGSKNWDSKYAELLKGQRVVIMPDADEHGEKWRDEVILSMRGIVGQIQVINIPRDFIADNPEFTGHDFADYRSKEGMDASIGLIMDGIETSVIFPEGIDPCLLGRPSTGFRDIIRKVKAGISTEVFNIKDWLPSYDLPVNEGDLLVLMANTSVGKTRLLHNIPFHIRSVNYAIFDLELSYPVLCQRHGAMRNNCSFKNVIDKIKAGYNVEIPNVDHISIQKVEKLTVEKIRDRVEMLERLTGQTQHVVCVDYIGLMTGRGSSYEIISNNVEEFKSYISEAGKVGVLTTQVARPADKDHGLFQCPSPFAAKNSGSLENSAQILLGFWKDEHNRNRLWSRALKYTHGEYPSEDIPLDAMDLIIKEPCVPERQGGFRYD